MSKDDPKDTPFSQVIGSLENRKLIARTQSGKDIWLGFGMSGLIGWSIAVPAVIGAMAGYWLDQHHPGKHSWTVALLAAGLVIGCWNAWNWVARENDAIHRNEGPDDE